MQSDDHLRRTLQRIDGRGYKAYRDLRGDYDLGELSLHVDHVQGDPFAAPSKLRARVPLEHADLPADLLEGRTRRLALRDYLARQVAGAIGRSRADAAPVPGARGQGARGSGKSGSGKSGLVSVDSGAQEVLERSAVVLGDDFVEVRLEVGLPAAGRRVLAGQAERLLLSDVPEVALRGLCAPHLDGDSLRRFVECVANQSRLRAGLRDAGLIAFVADGCVLPRATGASDHPLRGPDVVPFEAPESLRVELPLAHPIDTHAGPRSEIRGLGVRRGITLIVGGGYHGKSTLLQALERAVYPHVPGDGREYVVTDPDVVKVRAEDGRRVERVDIGAFIGELPGGRATDDFSSDDASGSTSQAANIVEAVEAGASGLLLDEDTSATNFMLRDARMQALVHKDHEPITPFLDRVAELRDVCGVSTVLVMGGCGDYFDVADTVVRMRAFRPEDASAEAREVARLHPTTRRVETPAPLPEATPRVPLAESFDASRGRREVKIDAKALDLILYGREPIDLRGVEQLLDRSQTRAIGNAIHLCTRRFMDGERTLAEVLDALDALLDREGLDVLDPFQRHEQHPGNLARPRRFEIAAAINRLRTLRMRQQRQRAESAP